MTTQEEALDVLDAGERLYAPVEVAHIVKLSPETVQRLCREGKIKAFKSGSSWRVTKKEVSRYIAFGPREVEKK